MTEITLNYLTWTSILCGFASSICWFRASVVKVSREKAVARRIKKAKKHNEKPNLGGVSVNDWDALATLTAQARWNSAGAFLGALAIALQGFIRIFEL